eukprot:6202993-Pleurochrysis_carterae.AAC.1
MAAGIILSTDAAEPGLMESTSGVARAFKFSTVHEGGKGTQKVVGVLVGKIAGNLLANESKYPAISHERGCV